MSNQEPSWQNTNHPARLEEILSEGTVRCHLSPRNCTLKEGVRGFCQVRMNRDGRLVTLNYGRGVHATEEKIETEAVYHYAPNERTYALGNIGCNLRCSYCQNWRTARVSNLSESEVYRYTPEGIIDTAQRHGIRCLSWTYNDPVVWHEFVLDTARLAKEAGLINLYKSAFYITIEAVDELLPLIDVFSVSIKTTNPEYYRKITGGHLQPVLEATKYIFEAGKHVEISNLMVTDSSDDEDSARQIAGWLLEELDEHVPLHFVRFHPDYKWVHTVRTPVHRLIRAREVALDMGVEHVYLGNVFDTPYTNTYCRRCNATLVTRYGLNTEVVGLGEKGHCRECGLDAHFTLMSPDARNHVVETIPDNVTVRSFDWQGDIRSLHVQVHNVKNTQRAVYHRRRHNDGHRERWNVVALDPGESYRFTLTKGRIQEIGPEVALPDGVDGVFREVFDRAHFPTDSVDDACTEQDTDDFPDAQEGRM